MPDEQSIADQIKKVLINPELSRVIAEQVVGPSNRPKGWSRRSRAPYYKEVYALELKAAVDEMLVDRQDRCYDYETWAERGIAKETLYLRVNQAKLYLLDHLDDKDKTYARLFELVEVSRKRGVGVVISFKAEFRNSNVSDFKPRTVIPQEDVPRWKKDMDEWLEDSDNTGETFFREHLMLDTTEVASIKASLAGLENVIASITYSTIKLVKIPS